MIEQIRARMAAANRGDIPGHYWYPLSVAAYDAEEVMAVVDVLCEFRTTMSTITRQFEECFAERQGARDAVMVNSGSSADLLVAFALVNPAVGLLRRGDEILVPAVTWPTHIWSLMMAGLHVRLVDVDPDTLNIDLTAMRAAVGYDTRAISVVHLMGMPVDMWAVRRLCDDFGLVLVEDCCEALDATFKTHKVGLFGAAGTFSFFFSHHMTTLEGGMVITDDPKLGELLRLLRAHGWSRNLHRPNPVHGLDPRYTFHDWGFNVRPTEMQAAFGLVQLDRLPGFHAGRRFNYRRFAARMGRHADLLHMPDVPKGGVASPFALPLIVDPAAPFTRDALSKHLEAAGVETRAVVAGNIVRHPAAERHGLGGVFPGADAVHDRGLYVGLHPFEEADVVDRVADVIDDFVGAAA